MSATLDLVLEHPDQGGWWEIRKATAEGCYDDKGPRQQDLWQEERDPGLYNLAKEQGNLIAAYS